MPEVDTDRQEAEYQELLAIFMQLARAIKTNNGQWESLEELMEARANIAIKHALDGFGITLEEAAKLIEKRDDLTDEQLVNRNIVIAAIDNLIDFSVAAEYQMAHDLPDIEEYDDEAEMIKRYVIGMISAIIGAGYTISNQYKIHRIRRNR